MGLPIELPQKMGRALQPVAMSLLIIYVVFQFILDFQSSQPNSAKDNRDQNYDAQVLQILERTSNSLAIIAENTRSLAQLQATMNGQQQTISTNLDKALHQQLTRDEFLREIARLK